MGKVSVRSHLNDVNRVERINCIAAQLDNNWSVGMLIRNYSPVNVLSYA